MYCSIKLSTKCEDRIKTFSDMKGIGIKRHHPSLGRLIFQHKGINQEKRSTRHPRHRIKHWKRMKGVTEEHVFTGFKCNCWDWRKIWRKRKQACKHKRSFKNWFIISYIFFLFFLFVVDFVIHWNDISYILTFEKVLVSVWQFYWCFWKIWKRNKSNNTSPKMIE